MEMPPLATPADLMQLALIAEQQRAMKTRDKGPGRPKRIVDVDPVEVIKLHLYGFTDARIRERLDVPLDWIGKIVRDERKRLGLKPRGGGRPRNGRPQ